MNIGFELIAETSTYVTPNHSFRMELYAGEVLLPLSVGTDTYNFNGCIWPQKIIAATGRRSTHDLKIALGSFQADPSRPIPVKEEYIPELKLKLINNKILDQAELKHGFSIRMNLGDRVQDILLARPDVPVFWEGRGEFLIPLGGLVA